MSDDYFDNSSWNEFCDQLKQAGQEILANAPDNQLDRVEGFRYLARLTSHALGRFTDRPNPLLPEITYNSPRIGGDNPDFLYGSCTISGHHEYIIRGNRQQAFNIGIGSYYGGLGSGKGLQCSGYLLLNDLEISNNGDFVIHICREKREGNWLPLIEESNSILVRQTVLNRGQDQAAELAIECLTDTGQRQVVEPLSAAAFDRSLRTAGLFVGGVVGQFLHWTNTFKDKTNEIHPTPPDLLSFAQGDPNTSYYNGYFNINDDEALVVDLTPPPCEYWNLQVTNHWLESLDFLDYQTHFNHANASCNEDGSVTLIIAKHDPGKANWIDTATHNCGCISLRWIKVQGQPVVNTRRVKLTDL